MKVLLYPRKNGNQTDSIQIIIGNRYINFEFFPIKFWRLNIWLFDSQTIDKSFFLETPVMTINSWEQS